MHNKQPNRVAKRIDNADEFNFAIKRRDTISIRGDSGGATIEFCLDRRRPNCEVCKLYNKCRASLSKER